MGGKAALARSLGVLDKPLGGCFGAVLVYGAGRALDQRASRAATRVGVA